MEWCIGFTAFFAFVLAWVKRWGRCLELAGQVANDKDAGQGERRLCKWFIQLCDEKGLTPPG